MTLTSSGQAVLSHSISQLRIETETTIKWQFETEREQGWCHCHDVTAVLWSGHWPADLHEPPSFISVSHLQQFFPFLRSHSALQGDRLPALAASNQAVSGKNRGEAERSVPEFEDFVGSGWVGLRCYCICLLWFLAYRSNTVPQQHREWWSLLWWFSEVLRSSTP